MVVRTSAKPSPGRFRHSLSQYLISRSHVEPPGVMQPGVTTTELTTPEALSMLAVAEPCVVQLPPERTTVGADV